MGIEQVIEPVLDQVRRRFDEQPINSVSERILYEVFLGALVNRPDLTLAYLEEKDPENIVMTQLFKYSSRNLDCKEERRLFSICFTNLMTLNDLPNFLKQESLSLIENTVKMLAQTSRKEAKLVKRNEKKKLTSNPVEGGSDSESDYSDDYVSSESDNEGNEERQQRINQVNEVAGYSGDLSDQ